MNALSTRILSAAGPILLSIAATSAWGLSPENKCEAAKNQEAGKYAFCRAKAEAKAIKKGTSPDYSKCDAKFLDKWAKAEQKAVDAGTTCSDTVTGTAMQGFTAAHVDAVASALDGGALPDCGDGAVNVAGEQCDGGDVGGESCTSLGFSSGVLACDVTCAFDTSGCVSAGLVPGIDPIVTATGETTSYGPGSDGDVQAGQALSYTDNGDGTITDHSTGLMWEKKDDSGGIHDKDNLYTWSASGSDLDGTVATTFLATLNGTNFAGYSDWRLPNIKELGSIVDFATFNPALNPVFHQSATCTGCTDVTQPTCSCTPILVNYWSSTTFAGFSNFAWVFEFSSGTSPGGQNKGGSMRARAVRGGGS